MKPLLNFKSSTFLAANNISKADANSAAENSFKTKQHLNGSNFFKLFFGIRNILVFFVFTILPINDLKSKECLKFLPFGHNDHYVHLPINTNFCVKYGNEKLTFKTDNLGGRYFQDKNNILQLFGDSQVLGLDIQHQTQHYLSKYFKNNFVIYAAPNNGPLEVIKFIKLNNKIINEKIVINFNLSVDLFRVYPDWNIENFVALRSYQLEEILDKPFKYKIIIAKSLLENKYFTVARKNENQMQELFMSRDVENLKKYLALYLLKLDKIIDKMNIEIDYVLTMPYWMYENTDNKFLKINSIEKRLKTIICDTFNKKSKLNKIYISELISNNNEILTEDKRHLKSDQISLIKLKNYC
ncbi:hypothetical protein N9U90_01400 [Candidatus Pelagibacter sp.]|nr:hypothetical protein [Candidatus Pelagibacter sp.]